MKRSSNRRRSAFIGVPQGEQLFWRPLRSHPASCSKTICACNGAALRNRFHCADRCCDAAKLRFLRHLSAEICRNCAAASCRRIHYWHFCGNGSTLPLKLGDIKYREALPLPALEGEVPMKSMKTLMPLRLRRAHLALLPRRWRRMLRLAGAPAAAPCPGRSPGWPRRPWRGPDGRLDPENDPADAI